MNNLNSRLNQIRRNKGKQELLLSFQEKKEEIDKIITNKVIEYKKKKGKNSHIKDITLKRNLLEAYMIRIDPIDSIITKELLSEYKNQEVQA